MGGMGRMGDYGGLKALGSPGWVAVPLLHHDLAEDEGDDDW